MSEDLLVLSEMAVAVHDHNLLLLCQSIQRDGNDAGLAQIVLRAHHLLHEVGMRSYFRGDWEERRPALQSMLAEAELLPVPNRQLMAWQRYARNLLHHGPLPLKEGEWLARRYFLNDLLEDYEDAAHAERAAIAARLYELLLNIVCDRANVWRGSGK